MKKTAIVIILGILLLGVVNASLVRFLSNKITGTINVEGPVFYTGESNILYMNEIPLNSNWSNVIDGSWVKRAWVMDNEEKLNGIDFYKPEIKFVAKVKIDEEFNNSVGMELELGYIDNSENAGKHSICSVQYISIENQEETIEVTCPTSAYESFFKDGEITDVDKFYYAFEPLNDGYTYQIKTQDTYVQITGVAE